MILNDNAKIVVDLAGNIETGNKVIEELEKDMGTKIFAQFYACKVDPLRK